MKLPTPTTVDFESFKIESRPKYPPLPTSVSIKEWGKKPVFLAWGHTHDNNCGWEDARRALASVWADQRGVLCQNAKFDLDVAETHFDLPALPWDQVHDTMLLLFLDDPHQTELGLKPSAERLLDLPPEEQDAVCEWLIANQPVPNVKISRSKQSEHYFAKYLAFAPGSLVGKYANGDTIRTELLFKLLYPKTVERGMLEAYNRERRLLPILLGMERQGIMTDHERLNQDVTQGLATQEVLDSYLLKRLKAPGLNLDSGEQLVSALVSTGEADPDKIARTPTGKYKSDKASLGQGIQDPALAALLKYRTQLKTCIGTFLTPWVEMANAGDGRIFTTWNQIRGQENGGSVGTRTGRLSASWFMNMPKDFDPLFEHEAAGLPRCPIKGGLPPLPACRSYIVADSTDHVLCGRDFASQELRVLAHFEDGGMRDAYLENPTLDLHQHAAEIITTTTGFQISRKDAKTIAFGILYGIGLGSLAMRLSCDVETAKRMKAAYLGTFPGIKDVMDNLKSYSKAGLPLTTWGGRQYYCEKPKVVDGRLMDFSYKMLNYLIQSSSADLTKSAIIKFHEAKKESRIILTVHDEILITTPKANWKAEMDILRECMNDSWLDVPMRSDGEVGPNWAEMAECD